MKAVYRMVMKLSDAVGIISHLLMCLVIFFQIVARYVFTNAMSWPEEAGKIFFILATYSSMTYCMRKNGHLRIEVVQSFFPGTKRPADLLYLATTGIYFLFSLWMLWVVLKVVYRIGADFVAIPIPMWTIWVAIMGFCVLISVAALCIFVQTVQGTPYCEKED